MKRRAFVAGALGSVASSLVLAQGSPGPGRGPGPGMGPGSGMGSGMGPGSGAGPDGRKWMRERLYGSTLMTLEERQDHQRKLWNAKTETERQQIRTEHRNLIEERARERKAQIQEHMDDAFFLPALSPL